MADLRNPHRGNRFQPGVRPAGRRTLQPLSSSWQRRLLPLGLLLLLTATGASGQRLLNLVPLGDDPTVDFGWAIEVDRDLVRSAPPRLELPAPDGRVLTVEMSVFEDRGDGNAMWSGGYAGNGYDSVVLTLQDGHLLGRFGLPEGGTYWIRSGRSGSGWLTEGQRTSAQACPGGVIPDPDPAFPAIEASRVDPPQRVASPSNHDRLDILMLYTAAGAERLEAAGWAEDGNVGAVMQLAIDYLNLVFRNNQISVTANMVHHQEAPAVLGQAVNPLGPLANNGEVHDLRVEHEADLVHLFFFTDAGLCGQAFLMTRRHTPANFWRNGYGITSLFGGCITAEHLVRANNYASQFETFAHEIGHNLGANHDPDNTNIDPNNAVETFAFGHHNFTPQPNVKSVMSYNEGRQEPFFSTVRVKPSGFDIGVAGARENERALQRTIHIAVQFSDHLPEPGEPPEPDPGGDQPVAPSGLQVIATGNTSVKLTWTDESDNEDGFDVEARLQGSRWQRAQRVLANTTSADVAGLESGGRYDFRIRAFNGNGARNSNVVTIVLRAPQYTDCVPSASQIEFGHGFTVSMCVEYLKDGVGPTVTEDAKSYGLESRESGLLYFFDRDNAEVLVKVLDACAVNGYRWVFVAPVTDLAFNLYVDEPATKKRWTHSNPKGGTTATTEADVRAFPCAAVAAASDGGGDGVVGVELVDTGVPAVSVAAAPSLPVAAVLERPIGVVEAIGTGEGTDCVPTPVMTLAGGYTVSMCVEYLKDGESKVDVAKDYGLDSHQSGLLYFFDRNNAEVLIKVLDGCGFNGYRWVFVAPVTDLAFSLTVTPPDGGEPWTHNNRLGQTASAARDTAAFACSSQ